MSRRALPTAIVVLAAVLASRMAAAAEPAETPPAILSPELKVQEDPTLLLRRAWADTEWNHYKAGREDLKVEFGGLWSWRLSERQEWAVQFKLPVAGHVAGETEGDADALGLGDIELAVGTAYRLGKAWRTGGGLELRTPSATDDVLGDNVWRLKPFWAVAWDEWTHSAKLVLAKQLERLPLSFAVSLKKSFDGGEKEFQFNFVTTYFFRTSKRETLVAR
ncbi:MAG: hypothetical protein M5U12_34800 [Verrucomicrobia bacterium]|nr:hypothetical protein [Verrucomicrobiota bacterium]